MPGFAFPAVGPWDVGSPPSRPAARSSRPSVLWSAQTASGPSRGRSVLPLLPRYLVALVFLCVPCSCKARLRGESLLPAPGVFPSTVGTPPPDSTPGNHWLSHVPRFPPCVHALVSDPGGVLNARRSASRTAAFQRVHAVGFHALATLRGYPRDHHYTYFGAQYRACILDSSGFRLPLPGLPADFSPGLLARL